MTAPALPPASLARLLDATDAELRALLVGAALALPDFTGVLVAADRAADAGELGIEAGLRTIHRVATSPLVPLAGYGRVTLGHVLDRFPAAVSSATVAGCLLGIDRHAFAEEHPGAAAVVLLAGCGASGETAPLPREVPDGAPAVATYARRAADSLLRAGRWSEFHLNRAALALARWCALRLAQRRAIPSEQSRASVLAVNAVVGALVREHGVPLDQLRDMQISNMRRQRPRAAEVF